MQTVGYRSDPPSVNGSALSQRRQVASHLAHNQKVVGSIPAAAMIIALLFWQFSREHVDLLDRGWLGKKFARLGHQCSGNFARKMCLASGFIGEVPVQLRVSPDLFLRNILRRNVWRTDFVGARFQLRLLLFRQFFFSSFLLRGSFLFDLEIFSENLFISVKEVICFSKLFKKGP